MLKARDDLKGKVNYELRKTKPLDMDDFKKFRSNLHTEKLNFAVDGSSQPTKNDLENAYNRPG